MVLRSSCIHAFKGLPWGCLFLHVSWWNQYGCCVDLVDFRTQHQQEWHRLEMTCFGVMPTLTYQSHTELAASANVVETSVQDPGDGCV